MPCILCSANPRMLDPAENSCDMAEGDGSILHMYFPLGIVHMEQLRRETVVII